MAVALMIFGFRLTNSDLIDCVVSIQLGILHPEMK